MFDGLCERRLGVWCCEPKSNRNSHVGGARRVGSIWPRRRLGQLRQRFGVRGDSSCRSVKMNEEEATETEERKRKSAGSREVGRLQGCVFRGAWSAGSGSEPAHSGAERRDSSFHHEVPLLVGL